MNVVAHSAAPFSKNTAIICIGESLHQIADNIRSCDYVSSDMHHDMHLQVTSLNTSIARSSSSQKLDTQEPSQ